MNDTKMLQVVLDKVSSLDKKVDKGFKEVNKRINSVDKRLDTIGLDVAQLQDDAPTT